MLLSFLDEQGERLLERRSSDGSAAGICVLIERARSGDETAVPALRKLFAASPEIAEAVCDLSAEVHEAWARRTSSNLLGREALRAKGQALKKQLLATSTNPLEALLADRIVLCAEQLSFFELQEAGAPDRNFAQATFSMKCLESLQRRCLRAIRTLAEVRRLQLPILQVNVARQQLNVAGPN